MQHDAPRFLPFGDAAILVEFGASVDRAVSARVVALDAAVRAARVPGLLETAPSFRSLMVQFDPLATDAEAVSAAIRPLLDGATDQGAGGGRLWRLPACYEGELAPDLGEVAELAGLTPAQVVDLHVETRHHVYMIGFLPGCPYMGDLPKSIDFPRKTTPRTVVPLGSVAIAVGLTVIYPAVSPGGWRLIGRTPTPLFDAAADPPALLEPGDQVRFEPVDRAVYERLARDVAEGGWRPEPEPGAEPGPEPGPGAKLDPSERGA